jgi:hypothetical protein
MSRASPPKTSGVASLIILDESRAESAIGTRVVVAVKMFIKKISLIRTYQILMRCQVTLSTLRLEERRNSYPHRI